MTSIGTDPFYIDKLNFYYGGTHTDLENLPEYQAALWDTFSKVYEQQTGSALTLSSASTDEVKESFERFIQHYALLHISLETLQSDNELPIPGTGMDFYLNYLNSFYGQYTETERTNLWNAFLHSKNLTSNPPDSPELREAFAKYINGLRMSEVRMEAATSLAPREVESRLILNEVMESIGNMLTTVEDLVKTQAKQLIFYGKWQEAYTEIMTSIPNLIPVDDVFTSIHTTVRIPHISEMATTEEEIKEAIRQWDLQDYTFGYNKTNLKDVIAWGIDSAMKSPMEWISFSANPSKDENAPHPETGDFQFRAVTDADGNITKIRLRFYYPEYTTWTGADLDILDAQGNPIMGQDQYGNAIPKTFADRIEDAETLFKEEIFCNLPDVTAYVNYYRELFDRELSTGTQESYRLGLTGRYLLGEYGGDDERLEQVSQENFQARAEQNAALQQFVENVRSLRKFVADKSKALQLSLADAKEGINKITALWTVILEMINNVTKSIFKEK